MALAFLVYLLQGTYYVRQTVVTVFIVIWSARLGGFLLYRVIVRKKDSRFDEIRENFWKFLGFWIFQMIWVFTVSLPVTLLNAAQNDVSLNALDYVGWTLWVIGFLIETIADQQKFNYINSTNKEVPFLSTGLWSWSRHPNYFGEILLWSGIFLSSCNVYNQTNELKFGYISIVSPLLTFLLLMFLSGIPLAEEKSDKKFSNLPDYVAYKKSTSILIPMPPSIFKQMPQIIKVILFFEYSIYWKHFNKTYDEIEGQ